MREHPARAALAEARRRDTERGPPAADDLPRRSDGEGHVLARGHDGDGRAHPRPDLGGGGHRAGRRPARLERRSRGGGGRMREVASGIHGRDERGQRRRRPAHPDARRGRGGRAAAPGRARGGRRGRGGTRRCRRRRGAGRECDGNGRRHHERTTGRPNAGPATARRRARPTGVCRAGGWVHVVVGAVARRSRAHGRRPPRAAREAVRAGAPAQRPGIRTLSRGGMPKGPGTSCPRPLRSVERSALRPGQRSVPDSPASG